jgi:hypothetical protein
MRTMNFDAIAAAAPLDRTASVVRDGSGDQWTPKNKDGRAHMDAPALQHEAPHSGIGQQMLKAMRGHPFGRFTVIGLAAVQNPKKGATWLCRCVCGQYEHRKMKAIRGPNAALECCYQCRALDKLRSAKPTSRGADAARLDQIAGGAK